MRDDATCASHPPREPRNTFVHAGIGQGYTTLLNGVRARGCGRHPTDAPRVPALTVERAGTRVAWALPRTRESRFTAPLWRSTGPARSIEPSASASIHSERVTGVPSRTHRRMAAAVRCASKSSSFVLVRPRSPRSTPLATTQRHLCQVTAYVIPGRVVGLGNPDPMRRQIRGQRDGVGERWIGLREHDLLCGEEIRQFALEGPDGEISFSRQYRGSGPSRSRESQTRQCQACR